MGAKSLNFYFIYIKQLLRPSKWRRDRDAKPEAIRKSFNRARNWLQEYDYIREYKNKIWFIDEPDGQDK